MNITHSQINKKNNHTHTHTYGIKEENTHNVLEKTDSIDNQTTQLKNQKLLKNGRRRIDEVEEEEEIEKIKKIQIFKFK